MNTPFTAEQFQDCENVIRNLQAPGRVHEVLNKLLETVKNLHGEIQDINKALFPVANFPVDQDYRLSAIKAIHQALGERCKERDDLAAELNRIKDGNSGLLDRALNAEKKLKESDLFYNDLRDKYQAEVNNWAERERIIAGIGKILGVKQGTQTDILNLAMSRLTTVQTNPSPADLVAQLEEVENNRKQREIERSNRVGGTIKAEEKPVVIDFEKKLTPVNQEAPEPAASLLSRLGDNAQKRAQEFISTLHRIGWSELDEALMTSWFANAIEHSSDVRRFASALAQAPGLPETEIQVEIGPNGTTLKFHGIPTAAQIKELEDLGLLEKELPAS